MTTYEKMRLLVRERMESTGVKQKFIAHACGYGEKAFSALLNGYKTITDDDIVKFCAGMGVTPNDVIETSSYVSSKRCGETA